VNTGDNKEKHIFKITEEKIRKEIEKEIEETDGILLQIREHLDMAIIEENVPMREIEITKDKIKEVIKNLKNNNQTK